jgi:hypothetical protein
MTAPAKPRNRPTKHYDTSHVLILDVAAFDAAMSKRGVTSDNAIGGELGLSHTTIGRLRARDSLPGVGFVAACMAAGLDLNLFVRPVPAPSLAAVRTVAA